MNEDNVYQASSERLITPPDTQVKRVNEQKIKYERERPILTSLLAYLKKQAAFYSSVESIQADDNVERFMCEVAVNKKMVAVLKREIGAIERLMKMFDKKK